VAEREGFAPSAQLWEVDQLLDEISGAFPPQQTDADVPFLERRVLQRVEFRQVAQRLVSVLTKNFNP
jgi:hypothetical protein